MSEENEEHVLEPDEVLAPAPPEDETARRVDEDGSDVPLTERARFTLDTAGKSASEALDSLRTNVQYWVDRGRYNKIRIKRKGKAVVPDIPVGALMAFEAATFFWTGLLRAALFNVVGRAFFEVELINEAETHYQKGLEAFLAGELTDADESLTQALKIDGRYARAHLQLGIVRKMQGKADEARACFEEAIIHAERKETAREAEAHLKRMSAMATT